MTLRGSFGAAVVVACFTFSATAFACEPCNVQDEAKTDTQTQTVEAQRGGADKSDQAATCETCNNTDTPKEAQEAIEKANCESCSNTEEPKDAKEKVETAASQPSTAQASVTGTSLWSKIREWFK